MGSWEGGTGGRLILFPLHEPDPTGNGKVLSPRLFPMHRVQQVPGWHPLHSRLLQPGVLCHRLPQVSPPLAVSCGTGLRISESQLISALSLSEIMLLNVQLATNPSFPQRSVCLGSPAGQPVRCLWGRDGNVRPGLPWDAVVLRNVLCEDSRVTLLSGLPR